MLDGDFEMNLDNSRNKSKAKAKLDSNLIDCGLCGQLHASGECQMIDRSENLAEYREMLILHADDEPWEERVSPLLKLLGIWLDFNFFLH